MRALLVIDVQKRFLWKDEIPKIEKQAQKTVAINIVDEIQKARSAGTPIAFIVYGWDYINEEQLYQLEGACKACTDTIGLARFLNHRHETGFEPVFFKCCDDAFTNLNLAPYLRNLGVTEVILAGCRTYVCVLRTAKGAVTAAFDVTLLANCTYDDCDGVMESQARGEEWVQRAISNADNPNQQVRVVNLPR